MKTDQRRPGPGGVGLCMEFMFSKLRLAGIDLGCDLVQVVDIRIRVKRVDGNLKGNPPFAFHFFSKNGECGRHAHPQFLADLFHTLFVFRVHTEID